MAYAEERVVPVVSDFDTFLVGSKGVAYEPTPPDQVKLMHWALDHRGPLAARRQGVDGALAQRVRRRGRLHPELPKYGFGDPTSYGLIGAIVDAMRVCGAVRHGAECFNYFPQELDAEFVRKARSPSAMRPASAACRRRRGRR